MFIPGNEYFKDKVVVITGAGGILCGIQNFRPGAVPVLFQ